MLMEMEEVVAVKRAVRQVVPTNIPIPSWDLSGMASDEKDFDMAKN